jgi:hypothetical protein
MLKVEKKDVLVRISAEDLRALVALQNGTAPAMNLPDIVDWLKALGQFKGFYLELYTADDFGGRAARDIYVEFGLEAASDKLTGNPRIDNLKNTKAEINIMNDRVFGTVKDQEINRTIVMPIFDAKKDPTGILRGVFFGLRLEAIRGMRSDEAASEMLDIATKFNGWMKALGYEGDDVLALNDISIILRPRDPEDFKKVITRIFLALGEMAQVNLNEMPELFRAARQLVTAL